MSNFSKFVIPVPPFGEQKRIIAKVDERMAVCDLLKTGINHGQSIQLQLADNMAEEALT